MSKDTETIKHDAEVAQFRFALIAPVIQGLYPDASATAYYKRVTASPLTLPDGSSVTYSYKTLEKWKSLYTIGGLDALLPNVRSDKGISRSLNEDAIAEIYRIKEEHPRMNATQIYEHLVREAFIPATWIFLYDEIALPEIWKSDVRKWKSSMRVYSRNVLSRPYTSRMDLSCSASMLVMLI